jgi:hypothetical protein
LLNFCIIIKHKNFNYAIQANHCYSCCYFFSILNLQGQDLYDSETGVRDDSTASYKYFIRSSYYSFTNWLEVGEIPNIYFYELHLGKEVNSKSKLGVKLARVKLFQPLGIQAWELDVNSKSEWFPGRIEEYGAGGFYQRNLWKGFYASAEIMPFVKVFLDETIIK